MKKVFVLGGYGTFGGRIALRARALGFEVFVIGRSASSAAAFCAGREGLVPLALGPGLSLAEALAAHRPFALIDAAGPFQCAGYETACAAIAARCHYVDIADGSAFVAGIAELDSQARAAGVAVISGASSVPALSGAVARSLAEGLERVAAVDIALSASSRGTAGRSVTAAILSYLGRAFTLRRGGRWATAFGWRELRRVDFLVAGALPLRGRLVATADVPDLTLLPRRLRGEPAVDFRAGTDAPWHNAGLWLLSWPVRWRWLKRPERLAGFLSFVQRWTRGRGSLRSAFELRLFGTAEARRLERSWTLIAERGDGPEIPALAAPLILERLQAGTIESGARDAGTLLALEDFERALSALATVHERRETELPPPLYQRIMGEPFERLPSALRRLHSVLRDGGAAGEGEVERGASPIARLVAAAMGFPPAGRHPLHVSFGERDGSERWCRDFGGHRFCSRLSRDGERLVERFGLLRFLFDLPSDEKGLAMELAGWSFGPVPLPRAFAPRTEAREWQDENGRFCFDVAVSLPFVGPLVRYTGWLVPS